jgi:hypothetical protein
MIDLDFLHPAFKGWIKPPGASIHEAGFACGGVDVGFTSFPFPAEFLPKLLLIALFLRYTLKLPVIPIAKFLLQLNSAIQLIYLIIEQIFYGCQFT